MNTEQKERLIREVFTAAVHGDFHLMEQHPGLQEVLPMYKAAFAAFSERSVRFPLQFSDEDEWVATRMVERGRQTGEFMGRQPTGEMVDIEVLMLHEIEDGRIVTQHSQAGLMARNL